MSIWVWVWVLIPNFLGFWVLGMGIDTQFLGYWVLGMGWVSGLFGFWVLGMGWVDIYIPIPKTQIFLGRKLCFQSRSKNLRLVKAPSFIGNRLIMAKLI